MDAEPPRGFVSARLVRRIDHAPDLATFWLAPDVPVAFAPGQYVTLALRDADGRLVRRAYSVASAPDEPALELFVECVAHGALTPCLFRRPPDAPLWVRARAAGRFTLDPVRSHHAMAATVTGIAPFVSMLRHHARTAPAGYHHRFLVLYGASRPDEHGPYAAELAALAEGPLAGRLTAVPTVSRPWEAPAWAGERGRVEDVLRKHLDALGWDASAVAGYACGNPDMVRTALGVLRRAGADAAHLHEEAYFTTSGDASPAPAAAPLAEAPAVPTGRKPGTVALRTVPRPS